MAEKELARFRLEDGTDTTFYVEVDEPQSVSIERVANETGELVIKAQKSLEDALDTVQPVISKVFTRVKSGLTAPADEVEIKFGLKLSAETGVVFSSVGGEVNFEVTLKWSKEK